MADEKRLLLHVGLPKTATTSLQKWCDDNRALLGSYGVDYPETDPAEAARKHQFVVADLMAGSLERIGQLLDRAAPDRRLLISTEGLTNHLYDFPAESLARFRALLAGWHVEAFLVVRAAEAWVRSYYKQLVLNPPWLQYGYATGLTLDEVSRLPRVRRLLDHARLEDDIRHRLGAASVTVRQFERDWFGGFRSWLGLDDGTTWPLPGHEHASCADDVVELVRLINRMGLSADVRGHCLSTLATTLATTGRRPDRGLGQIIHVYTPLPDRAAADTAWRQVVAELLRVTEPGGTTRALAQMLAEARS